jgi:hypothetical protein
MTFGDIANRPFKKTEGITPGAEQGRLLNATS